MPFSNHYRQIPIDNGLLLYFPEILDKSESDRFMHRMKQEIQWKQETIRIFGKSYPTPRLTAWYGDEGKDYSYSGLKLSPNKWVDFLVELKSKIEISCGFGFNSVLLNWYRDGNDSMGWHSDDEKELGRNPVIASLSLGAPRLFRLRNKHDHKKSIGIVLENGSLLLMADSLQHHWQHSLPRTTRPIVDRINLTFRAIID
ncbi:MAG: alpha-ketoglutarate-dependent dioxygenase AlkB [Bacteroidales bacterium]|nr:alpha-ketoglutarate-dependent dioxygenase AlkB [Bacteroidales bacterium]